MLDFIHPQLRPLALPIDSLCEDPSNANKHGDRNLAAIAESFKRFGQRKPVVVRREGMVVEAGNGTLAALREAGWTHLACVVCDDDEQTAMAFGLVDNQSARLAEWDFDALRENVETLLADGYDVLGLGWSGDELADVMSGKAQALAESLAPSAASPESSASTNSESAQDKPEAPLPEPPAEPVTQPGDIWQLGNHRVICGDCRDPEVVARLLDGERINVAFTSPPYASQRKYDESSGFKPIHPDAFVDWFEAVQANVRTHLADDGSWFVNIKEHCEDGERSLYVKDLTLAHKRRWGWRFIDELVWRRASVPGRYPARFKNEWEPVFHFSVSKQINTSGMALPGNVLNIATVSEHIEHSAVFPVGLPSFFIKAYSDAGDVVYDPFMGSGTTIIAAEREGRRGYGCELSPRYCDVIVARWEAETGKKAERLR